MSFPMLLVSLVSAQGISVSETIVVTGDPDQATDTSFETRHRVNAEEIAALDAASADEILTRLPSVHVPINSRGEAIPFLRSAGERQIAIFFEGAALNVPWDNRLDISLIPAPLLSGGVRIAAGPLAPHYGVNALGAISLAAGSNRILRLATGSERLAHVEAAVPIGSLLVGGSWAQGRGDPLSHQTFLPYSQNNDDLRTNTDRQLGSLFARVETAVDAHDIGITAFYVGGAKGIAPEGNSEEGARFWRYPYVEHVLVTANATSELGLGTSLDSSAWHQSFSQKIDSYTGADYETIEQRQVDRDRTWGLRELLTHRDDAVTFVGSMNFLHSTHYHWDIEYADGRAPITAPQPLIYSQRNWSLGGEVEYAFSSNLVGEVGVGYDRVDYLRTGDKPPVRHAAGWTGRLGAVFDAGSGWRVRAALGYKIRAATMRELFGQSLNRFLINPDLLPERIVTAEVGIEWRGESGEISFTPFLQDVNQTIDQRQIGSLRQRINLEGSTVHGMEFVGNWQPWSALKISGSATWTRVRRKDSESGEINRIAEKPALLAGVRAEYADGSGFTASIEAEHIGRAWSANDEGTLVPLKRSTALNGRLSYLLELPRRGGTEIFLRVDNVTDILVEPQLGLPAPGRTVRVGIKFK